VEGGQRHDPAAEGHYHSYWGVGEPRGLSGRGEENLSPPGFDPRTARTSCRESPYRLSCRSLRWQKVLKGIVFSASSFVFMDTDI
jgi:hypothetical protein